MPLRSRLLAGCVIAFSAILGLPRPAQASLIVVTSRSAFDALGPFTPIDWSLLPRTPFGIVAPNIITVDSRSAKVNADGLAVGVEGTRNINVPGFASGDNLLFAFDFLQVDFTGGFVTGNFPPPTFFSPVQGFGMQIEPECGAGECTGNVRVFVGTGTTVEIENIPFSFATATGVAPFVGIVSDTPDILAAAFTAVSPELTTGVTINRLDVLAAVPEPSALALLAVGILGLFGIRRWAIGADLGHRLSGQTAIDNDFPNRKAAMPLRHRYLLGSLTGCVIALSAVLGLPRPAQASLIVVTSRSAFDALGPFTPIDWSALAPRSSAGDIGVATVDSRTVEVGATSFVHGVASNFTDASGFAPEDNIVFADEPLQINFTGGLILAPFMSTAQGFGTQVVITTGFGDIRVMTTSGPVDIPYNSSGPSAPFIGIISDTADIMSVRFIGFIGPGGEFGQGGGILINRLDVLSAVTAIPEPSALALLAAGILGLIGVRRLGWRR